MAHSSNASSRCNCLSLSGSVTLHHWQQLAKPNLGGILHPRPGVLTKDFKELEVDIQHVYSLNDLEEDEPDLSQLPGAHGLGKIQRIPPSLLLLFSAFDFFQIICSLVPVSPHCSGRLCLSVISCLVPQAVFSPMSLPPWPHSPSIWAQPPSDLSHAYHYHLQSPPTLPSHPLLLYSVRIDILCRCHLHNIAVSSLDKNVKFQLELLLEAT